MGSSPHCPAQATASPIMTDTQHLKLPYMLAAQSQKHVTYNETLRVLDAIVQLSVLDRDLVSPPTTPLDGQRYIPAANASGAWAGKSFNIAAFQDGAWMFYVPQPGWLAWIADESRLAVWTGTVWSLL
jgi:Protein of unknown function (DUF2793)